MKNYNFLILTMLIILSSCSDDSSPTELSLNNTWKLNKVECYCGFSEDYDFAKTQLDFDENSNKVTVIENGSYNFFGESETHTYSLIGQDSITFNGRTYNYYFEDNNLKIYSDPYPETIDDEALYIFKR